MPGYRVTIYVLKEKRVRLAKLSAKGTPGIFLSMADANKMPPDFYNFYVFSYMDRKVLRTLYVTFYEDFGDVADW